MSATGFSIAEKKVLKENKYAFQAEINRLMGILINSLYSNRDIFLREVISNASDALDKLRFLALTNKEALGEGDVAKLEIRIFADKKNRILHVRDSGIGMTKEDLVNNLGRIAKSGTADFIEKLSKSDSMTSQIGQFGVGFYSTFLAAHTVTVTTKHNDDVQYVWESSDEEQGAYTISEDPRGNTLGRGTMISMHLKKDADEYLEDSKLKEMIRKYSEFINFPIYLWTGSTHDVLEDFTEDEQAVTEEELRQEEEAETDELIGEESAQRSYKTKAWEWKLVNAHKPIWTRKPSQIEDQEYANFFRALTRSTESEGDSNDTGKSLHHTHFTAEGDHSFTGLLYVPATPPFGMFEQQKLGINARLRLYVKRVFITDSFDLLPKYLAFLVGVVDSDDLPLNISRESLQQHKIMDVIRKKLVRKAIAMFQKMADEDEKIRKRLNDSSEDDSSSNDDDNNNNNKDELSKYETFYQKYHANLKLGAIEDYANRARLSKLLRFNSYRHTGVKAEQRGELRMISLAQYVEEMKPKQDKIYYLGGETRDQIESSPLLEGLVAKGYDVLYFTDPIDEYLVEALRTFELDGSKYSFADVGKEGIKVDADEERKVKHMREEFKPLTDFLKKNLQGKFYSVKLTNRLRNTPCALVAASNSYSANMERIMKAQALGAHDERLKNIAPVNKVLELNPFHPIIVELLRLVTNGQTSEAKEAGQLLFDGAMVSSGYSLEQPLTFAQRLYKALATNLKVDTTEFDEKNAKPRVYDPSEPEVEYEPEADEKIVIENGPERVKYRPEEIEVVTTDETAGHDEL